MPSWQGKSSGTTLGYKIFITLLKGGGVGAAYILLYFVSFYYFLFSKSSRYTRYYFRQRLGFGYWKSFRYRYKNYFAFGQSLIDKVVVQSGIKSPFSFHFDGEENLFAIAAGKKGGLLLSAHIGNWEAAGHLLERLNTRINIVMFDGEHRKIKDYLQTVTGDRNANIIVIKDDLSHIYAINEALSNNELVCMHADRFVERVKTITVDFLGKPARFPAGPFVLAAQFKVPVSYVFAMKEKKFHYHFYATPIQQYDFTDRKAAMHQMTKEFAAAMEKMVHLYPEQWYNYYDFWAV
ncbi:MAG: lipid A biosynthesis acyltransferase [Chitinophagaceae bacterium]|nr:lipid A biosynthesis acyltransferase [Chitinophagaceae bacterium]MCW5927824.1 lipid A biosynthesis acyltransferase [Chitinophagaceae bacterium]